MSIYTYATFTAADNTSLGDYTPDTGTAFSGGAGSTIQGNKLSFLGGSILNSDDASQLESTLKTLVTPAAETSVIGLTLHANALADESLTQGWGVGLWAIGSGQTTAISQIQGDGSGVVIATGDNQDLTGTFELELVYSAGTIYLKKDGVTICSAVDSPVGWSPSKARFYMPDTSLLDKFLYATAGTNWPSSGGAPTLTSAEVQADGLSALLTFDVPGTPPILVGSNGAGLTFTIGGDAYSPTTITAPATNQLQAWIPLRPQTGSAVLLDYSTNNGSIIDSADPANVLADISALSATNSSTFEYPTTPQAQAMTSLEPIMEK